MDKSGWWVAAILFVLLIFRDLAKKWVTEAIEALRRVVFRWMAGSRLLRARALSRYRRGVIRRYEYAHIPFVDTKLSIREIYVPPAEAPSPDLLRVVVTGAPGAGKSMLLRHMMLTSWDRVPVFCELHRHNGNDLTIEEHVAQQFELSGFPRAQRFLERALRAGRLAVFLDGFDEVNTADRPRVAEMIKDFAARYPLARIVATCRTAVYDGQLAPELTERYAVGEFDERMIRRFLRHWPGIEGAGRVQQLMEALHDTPRVMQLARNPLLLTMIAYLYAQGDERRQLPHSRAEFYQEATDYLLRRLKDAANRFDGQTKKAVLQRLALACMDAPASTADRLSLPYRRVIDITSQTLPELNEAAQQARPVLAEIVERSGLLLAIDGGDRYQFAHLTLQEFLAACELRTQQQTLIDRYRADPTRWRECVKLWCGLTEDDCTEIVWVVYELEPLLGLECLADARKLGDSVADRIIDEMLARLYDPAVVDAFGVVAADPRPRGVAVYERLLRLAEEDVPGAVDALAATNTTKACAAIEALALKRPDAQAALVRMGDLAVPSLARLVPFNYFWPVDGLATIATPTAVRALADLLWTPNGFRAAWHLASLITDPEAEAAMRAHAHEHGSHSSDRAWFWAPFGPPGDRLSHTVGRIGDLLSEPAAQRWLPYGLGMFDPRVVVPLWLFAASPLWRISVAEPDAIRLIAQSGPDDDYDPYLRVRATLPDDVTTRLMDHVEPVIALHLLLLAGRQVSRQDWWQARRDSEQRFDFDGSPHHRTAFGAVIALLLTAFGFAGASLLGLANTWGPAWLAWTTAGLTLTGSVLLVMHGAYVSARVLGRYGFGWLRVAFAIIDREFDTELWRVAVTGTATALAFLVTLMNFQLHLGWWAAVGVLAAAGAAVAFVVKLGLRKRDRGSNPLRELMRFIY